MDKADRTEQIDILSEIFKLEMSGVIRYMHYSFMIMGNNRIPIQKWFRDQSQESMQHAILVGEKITSLGGHPPLITAPVQETANHKIDEILRDCLKYEEEALTLYIKLVTVAGSDIALEEMARGFVRDETEHIEETQKMLRQNV
jgi:bacterioferritin